MTDDKPTRLGIFDRYLSLWVALCIGAGVAIGVFLPAIPEALSKLEYAQVSVARVRSAWREADLDKPAELRDGLVVSFARPPGVQSATIDFSSVVA